MRCLADFVLDSDLCLPKGAAPLKLHEPNGSFTLELSNAEHDPASPEAVLSAQLIFEADTLDANTRELARDKLADALNSLTYANDSRSHAGGASRAPGMDAGTLSELGRVDRRGGGAGGPSSADPPTPSRNGLSRLPGPAGAGQAVWQ